VWRVERWCGTEEEGGKEQAETEEMIGKRVEQYWDIPICLTMAANGSCVPVTGTPVRVCG
jgi:hypothetical protein